MRNCLPDGRQPQSGNPILSANAGPFLWPLEIAQMAPQPFQPVERLWPQPPLGGGPRYDRVGAISKESNCVHAAAPLGGSLCLCEQDDIDDETT